MERHGMTEQQDEPEPPEDRPVLADAIDVAGREDVFAFVRSRGWNIGEFVPVWAWWLAVDHVMAKKRKAGR